MSGGDASRGPGRGRATEFTDDEVHAALRRAAAAVGEPLSVARYDAAADVHGGPSSARVVQRAGSWNAACTAAGLAVRAGRAPGSGGFSRDTVLAAVVRYLADPAATGSYADYQAWARRTAGAPSGQTLRNQVGTWSDAKAAALAATRTGEDA